MPKRDKRLYVEDILDSAEAIKEFTKDLNFEDFLNDRKHIVQLSENILS